MLNSLTLAKCLAVVDRSSWVRVVRSKGGMKSIEVAAMLKPTNSVHVYANVLSKGHGSVCWEAIL